MDMELELCLFSASSFSPPSVLGLTAHGPLSPSAGVVNTDCSQLWRSGWHLSVGLNVSVSEY